MVQNREQLFVQNLRGRIQANVDEKLDENEWSSIKFTLNLHNIL